MTSLRPGKKHDVHTGELPEVFRFKNFGDSHDRCRSARTAVASFAFSRAIARWHAAPAEATRSRHQEAPAACTRRTETAPADRGSRLRSRRDCRSGAFRRARGWPAGAR